MACTLNALKPGCSYRVRVAAHNSAGWGGAGFPADVVAAATCPEPPRHLDAVRRSAAAHAVAPAEPPRGRLVALHALCATAAHALERPPAPFWRCPFPSRAGTDSDHVCSDVAASKQCLCW